MNAKIEPYFSLEIDDQALIYQVRFKVENLQHFLQYLRSIGKQSKITLICFNREAMVGISHVKTAIQFALRSFSSDSPISRSIEVEALLFAAGTRQTGLVGPFGIHTGDNESYLCVLPPREEIKEKLENVMEFVYQDDWEKLSREKIERLKDLYGISEAEITISGVGRLPDLVM
ncbi:MAG: hypothetical protein LUQ50_06625, partial [Methanospirillum sp.]|uniref:KEOPS complex subunit Cgi121 n=1 Tax=Methanospirillum sp. TaxID=45200 RepID=UPI00236D493B